MKGIIFNLLEKVVVDAHGENAWDDIIETAQSNGSFTSLGNYPDEEIEALVGAASLHTGQSRAEILRWFGEHAMPLLREAYPSLFADHANARDFVLSVNAKIHPEVRKLYPEASCPFFHIRKAEDNLVEMDYESERDLADLAHGFVTGAAKLYGDEVEVALSSSGKSGKVDRLHLCFASQ